MAAQPRRSDGSREHGELPERPIHGLSVEALAIIVARWAGGRSIKTHLDDEETKVDAVGRGGRGI